MARRRAERFPKAAAEELNDKLFELRFQALTSTIHWKPKPLEFVRPYYENLEACYKSMDDSDSRALTSTIHWKPKPLEFVRPYYENLEACYKSMDDSDSRKYLADDILSVLAQTTSPGESIKYRLLGSGGVLRSWGPGYIMHLKSELRSEVPRLESQKLSTDQVLDLGGDICDYLVELCRKSDKEQVFILKYCNWAGCPGSECKGDCGGTDCE
ncbi:hypothetical protein Tsubulata_051431, partial [Turnera subulata]